MEGSSHGVIEALSHFSWGLRKTRTLRLARVQAEIKTERLPKTGTEPLLQRVLLVRLICQVRFLCPNREYGRGDPLR
jgi:hypothetical protein